jgi:tetratricopeptide (TPR) repeat protein
MKALNIAQEQMTYFSKEKLALGALLSWYISAKASYNSKKIAEAINICEKSLKIAQSAKISCSYFAAIFQMLLAKCYLAKGDEESAKMYNEMAIELTNQNDIPILRMFAYEIRAKIMQEGIMRIEESRKIDFAKKTMKVIEKSYNLAKTIDIDYYVEYFKKEKTSFKAFCKLNNLEEKERVIKR